MNLPEDPSNLGYDFIEDDDNERTKKFNFMTTVSIPVYDKRENEVSILVVMNYKKNQKIEGFAKKRINKKLNQQQWILKTIDLIIFQCK